MHKITIIGNLGRDPEMRYMPSSHSPKVAQPGHNNSS